MSALSSERIQSIIEAALMVAGRTLSIANLQALFADEGRLSSSDIRAHLAAIQSRHTASGIELKETASGFRLQAKIEYSPWLSKLWEERAPRYSRAFLETLAIIVYKQPITRAEIEALRGVTVSSAIVKTLMEREWIRVIGYREIPGKPAIYGTTKTFLDNFNLKSLTDLPELAEFKTVAAEEAQLQVQLALADTWKGPQDSEAIPEEKEATLTQEKNHDDPGNILSENILKDEALEAETLEDINETECKRMAS